jgi:hypothetical protein
MAATRRTFATENLDLTTVADATLRRTGLTATGECSTFVLMEVETLGVARSLGWKVHMRCNDGYRQETRSLRKCVYRKQLKGAPEAKPTDFFLS